MYIVLNYASFEKIFIGLAMHIACKRIYIYNTGISINRNVTLSYVEMFQMFPPPLNLPLNVLIFYLYRRVVYLDRINCHRDDPDDRVNFLTI